MSYLETYSKYYVSKYVKKSEKEYVNFLPILERLEKQLNLEQIIQIRQVREEAVESLQITQEIEKIEAMIKSKNNQSSIGAFFSFKSPNINELMEKKKSLESQKSIKNSLIITDLEKDEVVLEDPDDLSSLGDTYVQYKVSIEIKITDIFFSEKYIKNLFRLNFSDFTINVNLGVNFQYLAISLEDLFVDQYKVNHPTFNRIVEFICDFRTSLTPKNQNNDVVRSSSKLSDKKNAFYIEVEINPNNPKSLYRLKVRNDKRIIIYLNYYSIFYSMRTFLNSLQTVNLEEIKKNAKKEVSKYISEGFRVMNQILSSEYKHMSVDIFIKLFAPKLVIPLDILNTSSNKCLLIDMG